MCDSPFCMQPFVRLNLVFMLNLDIEISASHSPVTMGVVLGSALSARWSQVSCKGGDVHLKQLALNMNEPLQAHHLDLELLWDSRFREKTLIGVPK